MFFVFARFMFLESIPGSIFNDGLMYVWKFLEWCSSGFAGRSGRMDRWVVAGGKLGVGFPETTLG